jgi:hypothetical protein
LDNTWKELSGEKRRRHQRNRKKRQILAEKNTQKKKEDKDRETRNKDDNRFKKLFGGGRENVGVVDGNDGGNDGGPRARGEGEGEEGEVKEDGEVKEKEEEDDDDDDDDPEEHRAQDANERVMLEMLNTLSNDCHGVGINIRLLGHVRRASKEPVVRALLLVEMLARTAKIMLRKELRAISVEARELPSRSVFIRTVVKHLNLLLGTGYQSHDYWEHLLRPKLNTKYEYSTVGIQPNEYLKVHLMVALQTTGRRMMVMSLLWSRLKESLGIDVLPRTNIELMKEDAPYIPSITGRVAPRKNSRNRNQNPNETTLPYEKERKERKEGKERKEEEEIGRAHV